MVPRLGPYGQGMRPYAVFLLTHLRGQMNHQNRRFPKFYNMPNKLVYGPSLWRSIWVYTSTTLGLKFGQLPSQDQFWGLCSSSKCFLFQLTRNPSRGSLKKTAIYKGPSVRFHPSLKSVDDFVACSFLGCPQVVGN